MVDGIYDAPEFRNLVMLATTAMAIVVFCIMGIYQNIQFILHQKKVGTPSPLRYMLLIKISVKGFIALIYSLVFIDYMTIDIPLLNNLTVCHEIGRSIVLVLVVLLYLDSWIRPRDSGIRGGQ